MKKSIIFALLFSSALSCLADIPSGVSGWYTPPGGFSQIGANASWSQGGKSGFCEVDEDGNVEWKGEKPRDVATQVSIEKALEALSLARKNEESIVTISENLNSIFSASGIKINERDGLGNVVTKTITFQGGSVGQTAKQGGNISANSDVSWVNLPDKKSLNFKPDGNNLPRLQLFGIDSPGDGDNRWAEHLKGGITLAKVISGEDSLPADFHLVMRYIDGKVYYISPGQLPISSNAVDNVSVNMTDENKIQLYNFSSPTEETVDLTSALFGTQSTIANMLVQLSNGKVGYVPLGDGIPQEDAATIDVSEATESNPTGTYQLYGWDEDYTEPFDPAFAVNKGQGVLEWLSLSDIVDDETIKINEEDGTIFAMNSANVDNVTIVSNDVGKLAIAGFNESEAAQNDPAVPLDFGGDSPLSWWTFSSLCDDISLTWDETHSQFELKDIDTAAGTSSDPSFFIHNGTEMVWKNQSALADSTTVGLNGDGKFSAFNPTSLESVRNGDNVTFKLHYKTAGSAEAKELQTVFPVGSGGVSSNGYIGASLTKWTHGWDFDTANFSHLGIPTDWIDAKSLGTAGDEVGTLQILGWSSPTVLQQTLVELSADSAAARDNYKVLVRHNDGNGGIMRYANIGEIPRTDANSLETTSTSGSTKMQLYDWDSASGASNEDPIIPCKTAKVDANGNKVLDWKRASEITSNRTGSFSIVNGVIQSGCVIVGRQAYNVSGVTASPNTSYAVRVTIQNGAVSVQLVSGNSGFGAPTATESWIPVFTTDSAGNIGTDFRGSFVVPAWEN